MDEQNEADAGARVENAVGDPEMVEIGDDQDGGDGHHRQVCNQDRSAFRLLQAIPAAARPTPTPRATSRHRTRPQAQRKERVSPSWPQRGQVNPRWKFTIRTGLDGESVEQGAGDEAGQADQ